MSREWGGWALDRDAARLLVERLSARPPRRVVEAGSGISTDLLRLYCDDVLSLDHDERYAHPEAHVAPLEDGWYDVELPDDIDFVLVDGPPMAVGRGMALPRLWPHLSLDFELWMDDANREHERGVVAEWTDRFPITVDLLHTSRGMFVIRRMP